MEVKRLQSWNINSTVSTPFSLSWSDDNKLAVVGKEGINILELNPDPNNDKWKLGFKRTLAEVSEDSPASHIDVNSSDFVTHLSKDEVYSLILDVAMAPQITSTTLAPSVMQHAWSPSGAQLNARCLLAVVTSWGQASLLAPDLNRWPTACDITKTLAQHFARRWSKLDGDEDLQQRYAEMKDRIGRLCTRVVAWGKRCTDHVPLVCAQRSNELALFQVSRSGKPRLVSCLPSGLDHITALTFISHDTIAAGDRLGRVKLLTFRQTQQSTTGLQDQEDSNGYTAEQRDIWTDSDLLTVTQFVVLPGILVVFKGHCILAVTLGDFQTATHIINTITLGGVCMLNDTTVVVTTLCGMMHKVSVTRDVFGSLIITSRQFCNATVPIMKNYGLVKSRGGALWASVSGITELKDQPPTLMTFYHIIGTTEPPLLTVLANPQEDLYQCVDHLELIRSIVMYKRVENVELLVGVHLPENPDWGSLSPYKLKVWRWFVRIKTAVAKRASKRDERPMTVFPIERHPLDSVIELLECLIVLHHVCSRVTSLAARSRDLSDTDRQSLHLMRSCLSMARSAGGLNPGPTLDLVDATLKLPVPDNLPTVEYCALCGKESTFNSWCLSTCPLNHNMSRCMLTLRQVSVVPYLSCRLCGLVALPDDSVKFDDSPTVDDSPDLGDLSQGENTVQPSSVTPQPNLTEEPNSVERLSLFEQESRVMPWKCIYCDVPLELIEM